MKNFVWIMIFALLLSGCGGPAAPVTTEPPTVPQIPETTTPVETTVMPTAEPIVEKTEEEIKAEIAELFVSRTVLENWYNNALFSTYENTSELDIFEMFRDGYSNGKATQEELDFLGSKLGRSIDPSKVGRITGAEMDEVLMQVFGKTRDQFDLNHEKIYCYEKTEPVYLWVRTVGRTSDCNVQDIIVNGDTVEVVHAIYDDLFLVTLQRYENRWIITSHQPYVPPLYTLPEGAVELTAEQIEQVNAAFPAEAVIDSEGRMAFGSAQAFLNCFYEKPEDIDLGIFLRYFSVEAVAPERVGLKADQAQFDQLRDQHGWWEHITDINKMPVPIHRYLREDVDAVMRRYTGVPLSELDDKGLSYLSEYDSYYNTTSDAGMACMNCVGGYITEDGAVLYRDPEGVFYRQENGELDITYGYTVLILRLSQEDGKYYIVSHLPLDAEREHEVIQPTDSGQPTVYTVPEGATKLTAEQIKQVNEAFAANNYDAAAGESKNPLTNFWMGTYASVKEIRLDRVVKYFCCQGVFGTENDVELLSAKYTNISYFNNLTRYPADAVDEMFVRYTGYHIEELYNTRDVSSVLYLAETDSYYSTASDAGWDEFRCAEGYIYGDIVVLRSQDLGVYVTQPDGKLKWMVVDTVLTLRLNQEDGRYYIVSHLSLEGE